MRPTDLLVQALGSSLWCPVNYMQNAFGIGIFYIPSSGGVLTCTVQHSPDSHDMTDSSLVTISRSGTVATVNWPNHGVDVGDSIIVTGSGSSNLDALQGVDVATVPGQNSFTYTVANTGPTASILGCRAKRLRVFSHATMVNMTSRTDGHYSYNVRAIRLKCTAYTSGTANLVVLEGMGR